MNTYTIINSTTVDELQGWRMVPDTIELIKRHLKIYTLDPVFENYGDFVYKPTWINGVVPDKYKHIENIYAISGNFLTFSHAFNVYTNDIELITEIKELVNKNKSNVKYQIAKKRGENAHDMTLTPSISELGVL